MSIEKYLSHIKLKEVPPGPFSVRLKYELTRSLFEKQRNIGFYPVFATAMAAVMLFMSLAFVFNPDLADKAHYAFSRNEDKPSELFTNSQSEVRSSSIVGQGQVYQVSDLSMLDDTKSYIVRPAKDSRNGKMYFVSEIDNRNKPKIVY